MSSPASSPGSAGKSSRLGRFASEEARLEHIAQECIAKALSIVLASRLNKHRNQNQQQSVKDTRNRWFNLETEEVDVATPQLDAWKRDPSLTLVAEIYGEKASAPSNDDDDGDGDDDDDDTTKAYLLESWTFQVRRKSFLYGSVDNSSSGSGSSSSSSQTRLTRVQRLDTPLVYKRAVIFLRSLFCFVRLLPAFSVYQATKRSPSSKLRITTKVRVEKRDAAAAAALDADSEFSSHVFKEMDTPVGNICARVAYVTNPVGALSKEYGNSVMYVSRPRQNSKKEAASVGVSIAKDKLSGSQAHSPGMGSQTPPFAPHSAPQVIRRQSWSFSRTQMQLEAANARNKFSDVMFIGPVRETIDEEARQRRPRENSSPMCIPNAMGSAARPRSGRSGSSSINSEGGSNPNLSQMRALASRRHTVSPGTEGMKALTAPGSSLTTRSLHHLSASPEACVVGFAMRPKEGNRAVGAGEAQAPKMELPISALVAAAPGQSIVKTPTSGAGSSVRSGDSSDMRMPLSCSPQFPFAMTPKISASASSLSYDFQASPSYSGSGIPSIRLVRRGTSPRDSSELASFNSSTYSPAQDHFLEGGLPVPTMYFGSYNNKRITLPGSNSGTYEDQDEDQDALPFALDAHHSSPGERSAHGKQSQDAAIGAFVRTLQDAPPLRNQEGPSLSCRTLSSAMLELMQLRETLDSVKTVVVSN